MPVVQLIAPQIIQPARRGRGGGQAREEQEAARAWLQQAREQDKAIELRLGPDERDETVKLRYRLVAKHEQVRASFRTISQRPYRNRKGREEYEAAVLLVLVADAEPEPLFLTKHKTLCKPFCFPKSIIFRPLEQPIYVKGHTTRSITYC